MGFLKARVHRLTVGPKLRSPSGSGIVVSSHLAQAVIRLEIVCVILPWTPIAVDMHGQARSELCLKAASLMDAAVLELFVPVVSCILVRKAIAPHLATRGHH